MTARRARRPRRRLPKEARRAEILDAALRAFVRGGYHGTQVEDVIREAGIARGTFYLHFESKHDVFAALVDRTLGVFLDARPPMPDGDDLRTAADVERRLRVVYRTLFETFHRHRALGRLLFEEAVGADKGFAETLDRHFRIWHERIAGAMRILRERGLVRRDLDVDVSADLVLGMVERLARRHLFQERSPDLPRLVDAMVALEMRGLLGKR
jgi:AcrR family transcriptional regulator